MKPWLLTALAAATLAGPVRAQQPPPAPIVATPLLPPTVQYPSGAGPGSGQVVQPPGQPPQGQGQFGQAPQPPAPYGQPPYQVTPQYQAPGGSYPPPQYQAAPGSYPPPQYQAPGGSYPPPQYQAAPGTSSQPQQYPRPPGSYPQGQTQQGPAAQFPQSGQPGSSPQSGQPAPIPQPGQPVPSSPPSQTPPPGQPQVQTPSPQPAPGQSGSSAPGQPAPEQPAPPNPWLPQGGAVLQALDKVNAQTETLTVKDGQTVTFRSLSITVQACVIRPPDMPQDAAALLTIADSHPDQPGFKGWMLKSDPSLSMLEHPLYDVRVTGCTP